MDWQKELKDESEISVLQKLETTLNKQIPKLDEQVNWNDFGVYIHKRTIYGIGFYSQKMEFLPKELWSLKNLEVLNFVNNGLIELPEEIGSLNSLKELYIGGNKIRSVPKSIGKLVNLVYLYLLEDDLVDIPNKIEDLINLKELSISSKKLDTLPDPIIRLKNKDCRVYLNNKEI